MRKTTEFHPEMWKLFSWEVYSEQLGLEYRQCVEEGLDVAGYHGRFEEVCRMPEGQAKEDAADALFRLCLNAPLRADFPYREPSDLAGILALRDKTLSPEKRPIPADISDHIAGAWYGRICGCLLGKPVEGIRTDELLPLLRASGNYPMYRYILSSDVTEQMKENYRFRLAGQCFADTVCEMPSDDDTNYTAMYQVMLERYGRDFTPVDVEKTWFAEQPKDVYCTAERVAYRNFMNGYQPPYSAMYKNPYREWIGAQIRGDYFGYINPGDPEAAAKMAFRDASVAQTKNGIYGEMFVAAMLAAASTERDVVAIVRAGMSQIPATSRLFACVTRVLQAYADGVSEQAFFEDFHRRYNEFDEYDWCATVTNAQIVTACLLWGGGVFGRSICMAVEQGFDTDCNGATVGSILGMRNGCDAIGDEWTAPLHDTLHTAVFSLGRVRISDLVRKTAEHFPKGNA